MQIISYIPLPVSLAQYSRAFSLNQPKYCFLPFPQSPSPQSPNTHQPRGEEDSQQSQAGTHHNEEQKNNKWVLLAHKIVRVIQPVWGPLSPATHTSSSCYISCCPGAPLQQVAPLTHGLPPHGANVLFLSVGWWLGFVRVALLLTQVLQMEH